MRSDPPAAKTSFKDRQREHRHRAIVDVAQRLMGERGYSAMSIDDVAAAVGISKPTFYSHFESKEDLGVEVLLRMVRYAQDQLAELAKSLPPGETARAMICWTLERKFARTPYNYAGSAPLFDHAQVVAAETALVDALAVEFARGQEAGSVRSDVDPEVLARTLHSVLRDPSFERAFRAPDAAVKALQDNIVRLLVGGRGLRVEF